MLRCGNTFCHKSEATKLQKSTTKFVEIPSTIMRAAPLPLPLWPEELFSSSPSEHTGAMSCQAIGMFESRFRRVGEIDEAVVDETAGTQGIPAGERKDIRTTSRKSEEIPAHFSA